jgi:adenine-specific DNA-methyltransferase
MAGLFCGGPSHVRLLDPGAGVGSLTAALVERLLGRKCPPAAITAICYEIDPRLFVQLEKILDACRERCRSKGVGFAFDIRRADFIEATAQAGRALFAAGDAFDCVIMNPPYRKINSNSDTRKRLRDAGIETTNLYSAFMLLGARQLAPEGEFASISPRSFCNGPYFRPFRCELLRTLSLRRLHVFESRTHPFKEDDVLQENVITYGVRDRAPASSIEISITGIEGVVTRRSVAAERIVRPDDPEALIHIIAQSRGDDITKRMLRFPHTLDSLGLSVSTGRVVEFRARKYLHRERTVGDVPLIHAVHFHDGVIKWPNGSTRKSNAIAANGATDELLIPSGYYVLTKRFSAKEQRRRIVAALYDPRRINAERVGFENKTNYIHVSGEGMDEQLARGLTMFLNSSVVDEYFRLFSGHTQVNAADLRRLPYPSAQQLRGLAAGFLVPADQAAIDVAVARLL